MVSDGEESFLPIQPLKSAFYPNSLRTDWAAWAERLKAVVLRDCLVCSISMFAPSSFMSARVKLSAPAFNVLTIAVVKSCLAVITESPDESVADLSRSVVVAAVRSATAASIFESAAQLLAASEIDKSPPEVKFAAVIPNVLYASSLNVTVRSSPSIRLVPLYPESAARRSI